MPNLLTLPRIPMLLCKWLMEICRNRKLHITLKSQILSEWLIGDLYVLGADVGEKCLTLS
jgi:hypothetical protein